MAEQEHTIFVGQQVEDTDVAGRWSEWSVVAVTDIVELVIDCVEVVSCLEQSHLVGESLSAEYLDDIGGQFLFALKCHVGSCNLLHTLLDLSDQVGSDSDSLAGGAVVESAEMSTRDTVLDAQTHLWHNIDHCLVENHA